MTFSHDDRTEREDLSFINNPSAPQTEQELIHFIIEIEKGGSND